MLQKEIWEGNQRKDTTWIDDQPSQQKLMGCENTTRLLHLASLTLSCQT